MTQEQWKAIGSKFKTTSSKTAVLFPCLGLLMGDLKDKRVLDVGCGDGFGVRWLSERGAGAVGCDVSEDSIASCRASDPFGSYEVMDARDLPMSESFDFVLSLLVLMTFSAKSDITDAVRSMAARLNESGRLIIAVTHPCFEHINASMETMTRHVADDYCYAEKGAPITYRRKAGDFSFTDFHWMIEDYADCLRTAGLVIEQIVEPRPVPASQAADPALFQARLAYPPYLVLLAAPHGKAVSLGAGL